MKYVTVPVGVRAVQWNGRNGGEVSAMAGSSEHLGGPVGGRLSVVTPGGLRTATPGDWIVVDADGLLEVVDGEAFAASYRPAP